MMTLINNTMDKNEILYKKIYNKIKEANNILLVTHERPDVDGLSSVCAMIELLKSENKNYAAYCKDQPAAQYNFLPHLEKINSDKNNLNFSDFDLMIIFDCGGIKRTGLAAEIIGRGDNQCVIEIDHHIKIDDYADIELRNPEASSATELVHGFFKANKLKINKNIASCVLAGILTDSGNFLYPATSDRTVEISSQMLARGASMPRIMERTLGNKTLPALKIWGKAMSRLAINDKYKIAFTVLSQEDIGDAPEEDLEGIPNFLGNLYDVKAVMLITELSDGRIKGSFRSAHPTADVSLLARALGGGGHVKAAGFTIEGRLQITEKGWKIV